MIQEPTKENGVVWVEDETLRQGFTQIPNVLLRRPDLSVGAKMTYMVLLSYAWQHDSCFPGQARMAADMGVTDRSVRNYLNELVAKGLLEVRRRGLGLTNLYLLKRTGSPAPSASENGTGKAFRSGDNGSGKAFRSGAAERSGPGRPPASGQDRKRLPRKKDPVEQQAEEEEPVLRPSAPVEQVWGAVLENLAETISPAAFETWLRGTSARLDNRGRFTVEAPNTFALEWIDLRLRPTIEAQLGRVLGRPTPIQVVVRKNGRGWYPAARQRQAQPGWDPPGSPV